ncbi:thermonuclease family protein [Aestuariivirga sp.]|uniref:thermonuclease family protein n=1 Tax=Aestuariivirga sp. TaxID=2650926 RepID=UPI00391B3C68
MGTISAFRKVIWLVALGLAAATPSQAGQSFGLCSLTSANHCVVDGDTIEVKGQRIRMIDYDTPEISEPKCPSEEALGQKAKLRLLRLLNSGVVEIRKVGTRDEDRYGRKLRLVLVDGRSVGDTLIREGLAWPWQGRRHRWCGE